jgi:hypothetical protein
VNITLRPIGGAVTGVSNGWLVVVSQPVTALSDLYQQAILGTVEITGGSFSGYVTSGVTKGYVVIVGGSDVRITPSPVTLGTSMSLNLSAMTQLD